MPCGKIMSWNKAMRITKIKYPKFNLARRKKIAGRIVYPKVKGNKYIRHSIRYATRGLKR